MAFVLMSKCLDTGRNFLKFWNKSNYKEPGTLESFSKSGRIHVWTVQVFFIHAVLYWIHDNSVDKHSNNNTSNTQITTGSEDLLEVPN